MAAIGSKNRIIAVRLGLGDRDAAANGSLLHGCWIFSPADWEASGAEP